jgi:peptide methionine sulfoxide reductase MsrB
LTSFARKVFSPKNNELTEFKCCYLRLVILLLTERRELENQTEDVAQNKQTKISEKSNIINMQTLTIYLDHQLNNCFDTLIAQCQQLRFNFIDYQKDKFRRCIEILSAYCGKIIGFVLSDEDAPNQINDFLQLFPSFVPFIFIVSMMLSKTNEIVR